jgi:RHS repeat-associated protein
VIQHNGETPVLQLANLHGDIIATAYDSETPTTLASTIGEANEYGIPATEAPPKYSWLGAHQIPTELPSGASMMGSRSYIPQLGRFLQPDPSPGGSANSYAYTHGNPVNETDLGGGWSLNETSGGLSAVAGGEGIQVEGGTGIAAGAIMPPPVNAQIEAAFQANPPWDQFTAGTEEYEEYEEEWEEEWEEWGTEGASFGPSPATSAPHMTEEETAGVYVQPLTEGQQPPSPAQKPLPLCGHVHEDRPCGRYVCGFPIGCLKAAGHWVKKYAKKITATITAGISAAVIGGVMFVATVGCVGAAAEDPLLEFDCYKIGAFGAGLTMTTAGLAVAPWIHHGHRKH